jgi:amidase
VHSECVTAVESVAKVLEELGHVVERAHPEAYDDPDRGTWFGQVWGVNAATALATWGEALGREITEDDVEPGTWAMAEVGRGVSTFDYISAVNGIQAWSRRMASWWEPADGSDGFDLLLTPTLAEPPAPLGTFAATREEPFKGMLRAGPYTPFTPAFNLSGQPAISLPLHRTTEGLPIGVHLVAAYAREDLLLALAAQLEEAAPWSEHRPQLHA